MLRVSGRFKLSRVRVTGSLLRVTSFGDPRHPTKNHRYCFRNSLLLGRMKGLCSELSFLIRTEAVSALIQIPSKMTKQKHRRTSSVSVKSKLEHAPPPRATPRAFDFFENYSNSSLPGPKCRSNAPHWGPFR